MGDLPLERANKKDRNEKDINGQIREKDRNGRGGESLCWRQGREAHSVVLVEAQ